MTHYDPSPKYRRSLQFAVCPGWRDAIVNSEKPAVQLICKVLVVLRIARISGDNIGP
jgi:hypothetical protein